MFVVSNTEFGRKSVAPAARACCTDTAGFVRSRAVPNGCSTARAAVPAKTAAKRTPRAPALVLIARLGITKTRGISFVEEAAT